MHADGSSAVRGCTSSLVALEETAALAIDAQGYLECLQQYRMQSLQQQCAFLKGVPVLRGLRMQVGASNGRL